MNLSCSDWSRWTTYLARGDYHRNWNFRNCTSKRGFRSYRNHPFDGWFLINAELFFKLATIFLNLTNRQKAQQIETVHTWRWEIKLLKVCHKIICICGSGLTVCVLFKAVKVWRKFQRFGQWVCIKFTCMINLAQLKTSI